MTGFIGSLGIALDKAASLEPGALAALFFIAALTEVGVPFPFVLDTTFLFVGYSVGFLSLPMLVLMLVLYLGGLAGSGLIYLLARFLGSRLAGLLEKRLAGLRNHAQRLTDTLSSDRAALAVAIGRLTPGMLIPVSIASGFARMPFRRFALGLALASVIIDAILISVGLATRPVVQSGLVGISPTFVAFAVAILVSVAWVSPRLIRWLRTRSAASS